MKSWTADLDSQLPASWRAKLARCSLSKNYFLDARIATRIHNPLSSNRSARFSACLTRSGRAEAGASLTTQAETYQENQALLIQVAFAAFRVDLFWGLDAADYSP